MFDGGHVLEKKHVMETSETSENHGHSWHERKHHQIFEFNPSELQRTFLYDNLHESGEKSDGHIEAGHTSVGTEKHEKFVIFESNAVIDPRAMMVHF